MTLQCGNSQWQVAYSFLHRVVDSDGLTHDVIEIGGQHTRRLIDVTEPLPKLFRHTLESSQPNQCRTDAAPIAQSRRKKAPTISRKDLIHIGILAPRPGLEPGTYGLTVRRSTN